MIGDICACESHPGMHITDSTCTVAWRNSHGCVSPVSRNTPASVGPTCLGAFVVMAAPHHRDDGRRSGSAFLSRLREILSRAAIPPRAPAEEWMCGLARALTLVNFSTIYEGGGVKGEG